jgi:hypothetical protein
MTTTSSQVGRCCADALTLPPSGGSILWYVRFHGHPIMFKNIVGKAVAEAVPVGMATQFNTLQLAIDHIALHWHGEHLAHVSACKIVNGQPADKLGMAEVMGSTRASRVVSGASPETSPSAPVHNVPSTPINPSPNQTDLL